MTVEEVVKAVNKKTLVVGIRMDRHSRELLNWALVKVAEPGDTVVAVHVCRNTVVALKEKSIMDDYLEVYEGLCNIKQVNLTGRMLTGSSIRKVLVREAKSCAAVAVVVGISQPNALGGWASVARYCLKRLPPTTSVIAIHNGKVVFNRCSNNQLPDVKEDPRHSFDETGNSTIEESDSEFNDFELPEIEKPEEKQGDSKGDLKDDKFSPLHEHKKVSPLIDEISEQRHGWPLLRRGNLVAQKLDEARKMSVVQWVMSLPDRSPPETPQANKDSFCLSKAVSVNGFSAWGEVPKELELLLRTNSFELKWFSRDLLESSTSHFSSENLIAKGGCSIVYRGILPGGKTVAVKILKTSKQAWEDFALEVDIVSSLKHKRITPLLGVCVEDKDLISVYDFLSGGSLEDNLHGNSKGKSVLPWEVRFNVAIGIAEAINYLHSECSPPVIHRDIKSSNILLSDEFEPQLSDFGLAIWGPTSSTYLNHRDVVGTFGYLAPEYFMYGKVSDKLDVYSFGVVLLELLSGRKPITSETPKGQGSLVMWAKPILESGDISGILDPNLYGEFDEIQTRRVVQAATLCLTRTARLRPTINQILELLRGEKDADKWVSSEMDHPQESEAKDDNDDEVYPTSSMESHLGMALLDVDGDCVSFSSVEQSSNHKSLEDYLRGRWSRSSSFD